MVISLVGGFLILYTRIRGQNAEIRGSDGRRMGDGPA
jgi:hypothetical protein